MSADTIARMESLWTAEVREAFRTDIGYAIEIARQGSIMAARRASKELATEAAPTEVASTAQGRLERKRAQARNWYHRQRAMDDSSREEARVERVEGIESRAAERAAAALAKREERVARAEAERVAREAREAARAAAWAALTPVERERRERKNAQALAYWHRKQAAKLEPSD